MAEYTFEARLPLDHVAHLVSLVKSGELSSNKGKTMQEAAAIIGELGALVDTMPGPVFGAVPSDVQENNVNALVEELETSGALNDDGSAKINPATIALLIQLAQTVLSLLKK